MNHVFETLCVAGTWYICKHVAWRPVDRNTLLFCWGLQICGRNFHLNIHMTLTWLLNMKLCFQKCLHTRKILSYLPCSFASSCHNGTGCNRLIASDCAKTFKKKQLHEQLKLYPRTCATSTNTVTVWKSSVLWTHSMKDVRRAKFPNLLSQLGFIFDRPEASQSHLVKLIWARREMQLSVWEEEPVCAAAHADQALVWQGFREGS